MKEKIEAMISYVFGKYDMRKGKINQERISKLLDFCMKDIIKHPSLADELQDNTALEFFVIQSIIYMMTGKEDKFDVEFVLFQSLLDETEEKQIGILYNDIVYCLCCFGSFAEEDYLIAERKKMEFANIVDLLKFCLNGEYKTLFKNKESVNSTHKKDVILYDGVLTPQQYLEMMTGKYFCLDADNRLETVENILDGEFGKGAYWDFSLDSIDEIMENGHKVVLVEIVNIIIKNDKSELEKLYRWFEVPDDWTKESVKRNLQKFKISGFVQYVQALCFYIMKVDAKLSRKNHECGYTYCI